MLTWGQQKMVGSYGLHTQMVGFLSSADTPVTFLRRVCKTTQTVSASRRKAGASSILKCNTPHTACPASATLRFDHQRQDNRMPKSEVFPTGEKNSQ